MSSHHIVRDYQEPSLICWEISKEDLPRLGELLEWSPVVVCHTQTAKQLIAWGIKVDHIFCLPSERQELQNIIDHDQPSILHEVMSLELSDMLQYLGNDGQQAFNIYGNLNAKECEKLLAFSLKWDIVNYKKEGRGIFCKSKFEKWVEKDTSFQIPSNVLSEGVFISEDSQFKTDKDGFVAFSASQPFYLFQFESE